MNATNANCPRCTEAVGPGARSTAATLPGVSLAISELLLPGSVDDAAPSSPGGPPIELHELLRRCGNNEAFATRMLEKLASGIGGQIEQLGRSVTAADRKETARLAHSIRGWAGNLAAAGLARSAARLESRSERADTAELKRCLASIGDEAEQCIAYLPTALAALNPPPLRETNGPRGAR